MACYCRWSVFQDRVTFASSSLMWEILSPLGANQCPNSSSTRGPLVIPARAGEPGLLPCLWQLQLAKENTASYVVILVLSRLPFQTPSKGTSCGDGRSWGPLLTGGKLWFLKMTSGCRPATALGPHLSPVSLACSQIYLHISVSCVVLGFDFY